VDIQIDIQAKISMQGHATIHIEIHIRGTPMDYPHFHGNQYSIINFYNYPFGFPWISMNIHA